MKIVYCLVLIMLSSFYGNYIISSQGSQNDSNYIRAAFGYYAHFPKKSQPNQALIIDWDNNPNNPLPLGHAPFPKGVVPEINKSNIGKIKEIREIMHQRANGSDKQAPRQILDYTNGFKNRKHQRFSSFYSYELHPHGFLSMGMKRGSCER